MKRVLLLLSILFFQASLARDYFLKRFEPYQSGILTPESFLGYGIGEQHTRHDLIVAYLEKLAEQSSRATLIDYGKTHEGRRLVMLVVSNEENLGRLEEIRVEHLKSVNPLSKERTDEELPLIINLAYNVHGNEPSSSEAALLSAYTLTASTNTEVTNFLKHAVIFIDPTINPDRRDRHTYWANMYKGSPGIVLSKVYNDTYVPVRGKECSTRQMPFISNKFKTYEAFASASLDDIYGEKLTESYEREVISFESVLLRNKGELNFELESLPFEAQLFPILRAEVIATEDEKRQLLLFGNIYNTEVETPRLDGVGALSITFLENGTLDQNISSDQFIKIQGNIKSSVFLPSMNSVIVGLNDDYLHEIKLNK